MGKRSTFMGYLRARGATNRTSSKSPQNGGPAIGVLPFKIKLEIADVSAASAASGVVAPAGARILSAQVVSPNGDASTVDIGVDGTADRFFNELDTNVEGGSAGSADTAPLTADTELWVGTGVTAGTGSATVLIEILMDDDGSIQD